MRTGSSTRYGILAGCIWPLAIAAIVAARSALGGAALEAILRENLLVDLLFITCCGIGLIVSPILLCMGLFKSDVELTVAMKPFAWSLFLQALGFAILLIYLRGLALPPFLIFFFYVLLYAAVIFLRRKKSLRRLAERTEV